ncbi:MAG TPA: hypothetical protein PKE63_11270 [Lacibacter sp.]|nr:hypothetical protein [Lacibacter sp.]HMO89278.1 hypothetical protein [Lacibacter sp.]HMP87851.1 hypothetical protein [Lacibacter sp.]
MQKLIAYIFFSVLALQVLSPALLVAEYHLNLGRYLLTCINKDKPASTCQGKCQLNKKMAENEKQQQEPGMRHVQKENVLSSRSFPPVCHVILPSATPDYQTFVTLRIKDISIVIFHPPRISWQ